LSVAALALVVTAAAAHAAWNLFAKRAGGGAIFVWLCAASASALWAPIAVTAMVLSPPALGAEALLWLSVSAVLHTGYYVALQGSYRRSDLSVVYPVARGTGALLAVAGAVIALGERPTILSLAGAAMIAVGILGLSGSALQPRATTILPAVGTGVLISLYTVWDAFVVTDLAVPALMLVWVADLGRGIVLAPLARRRAPEVARIWRAYRREVLGVAVLSPLAYVLVLLALHFAPVTYVAPTREVSILFGVVIGRRLLGEADLARRLAATTAVIVGMIVATIG
jgi:drug/metabolite transporter (DMT)-like permease